MFIHNKIKIKNKIFYKNEKYVKMKQIKKPKIEHNKIVVKVQDKKSFSKNIQAMVRGFKKTFKNFET